MKHRSLKPAIQSQCQFIILSQKPVIKSKLVGKKNNSGRNNQGKITVSHKGGGHKKKYRIIEFLRNFDSNGIVISIEYDPNRNANIAAIYDYYKNKFFYILAIKNLKIGHIIQSGVGAKPTTGNSLPLFKIPEGCFIHNVSVGKTKPAQIARSAGSYAIIKEKNKKFVKLKLKSGELRFVSIRCFATIGIVGNESINLKKKIKAGQSRWKNKRPTVRGVAMNPVDHPHGGGEGKKSGKGLTPWSKPNKRGLTRKKIRNKLIILER